MQDRPICFDCHEVVEHSPIYEAPCGHDRCPSTVFHPICLMKFRDKRSEQEFEIVGVLVRRAWSEEHTENEENRP